MINDRFTIEEQIATGSMVTVYRATEKQSQRRVAISVLQTKNSGVHKWFASVSKSVAALEHPSIVPIYGLQKFEERPALITVLNDSTILSDHLTGERFALDEVLELIAQLASALDLAHSHDILHREVRPENISVHLEEGGQLRGQIINWGMSQMAHAEIDPGTVILEGTLAYMSPEAVYATQLDGRSDLFSLGVVLYQLLTGYLPAEARTENKYINPHFKDDRPIIPTYLPVRVGVIVVQALATERTRRFENGAAMADALRDIAETLTESERVQYDAGESLVQLIQKSTAMSKKKRNKKTVLVEPELMESGGEDYLETSKPNAGRRVNYGDGRERNQTLIDKRRDSGRRVHRTHNEDDLVDDNERRRVREAAEIRNQRARQFGALPKRQPAPPPQERIVVQLAPGQLRLDPGESEQILINLFNEGDVSGDYSLKIKNQSELLRLDLSHRTVSMVPGARASVTLTVHAPKHSELHAGEHRFRVIVASNRSRSIVGQMDGRVIVTPFEQFSFNMQPQRVKQNKTTQVIIKNEGNVSVRYRVSGRDQAAVIDYDILDPVVEVGPGEEQSVPVKLSVHERSVFGKEERYPFEMQVRTTAGDKRAQRGTLAVQPYLPTLYLAISGGIFLVGLIFLLVTRLTAPSVSAAELPDLDLQKANQACSVIHWLPKRVKNVFLRSCRTVQKARAAGRDIDRLEGVLGVSGEAGGTAEIPVAANGTDTATDTIVDPNVPAAGEAETVLEGINPVGSNESNTDTPIVSETGNDPSQVNAAVPDWVPITESIDTPDNGPSISRTALGAGENAILLIGGIHSGYAPSTVQIAEAVEAHFRDNPELVPDGSTLYVISNFNPSARPLVRQLEGRYNANGVDLNRNFNCNWTPNPVILSQTRVGAGGGGALEEPEARMLEDWIVNHVRPNAVIVLGASGGEIIAGGCGGATAASADLAQLYEQASGIPVTGGSDVTGDVTDWLASSRNIPAIFVLVSDLEDGSAEIDSHIRAISEILQVYR